jgi:hypothetical protein
VVVGRIMVVVKRMEMARKERWLKEGTIWLFTKY